MIVIFLTKQALLNTNNSQDLLLVSRCTVLLSDRYDFQTTTAFKQKVKVNYVIFSKALGIVSPVAKG
jgi:hypothetical protein